MAKPVWLGVAPTHSESGNPAKPNGEHREPLSKGIEVESLTKAWVPITSICIDHISLSWLIDSYMLTLIDLPQFSQSLIRLLKQIRNVLRQILFPRNNLRIVEVLHRRDSGTTSRSKPSKRNPLSSW